MLIAEITQKDLGRVKFGQPIGFNFILRNQGDVPVEITKIGVGCTSCTKASTKNTRLAPGETGIIDVVFTPGSIGKQKKYVNIVWDGLHNLKFEFTAESYA